MGSLALGMSRLDIPSKESALRGVLIGFEKKFFLPSLLGNYLHEKFLTSQLKWYLYLPQKSVFRCGLCFMSQYMILSIPVNKQNSSLYVLAYNLYITFPRPIFL